ncbi:MAG: hypothetical protein KAS32_02680 [Candidatus Peribacteraceae bacterium]|nr:hypothetical protein [Candidatus Peribacteraceae bacterium]
MGILFLEDPTGKIEVTLFPKVFAEIAESLEDPNAFFVIEGTLDLRGGMLQLRSDTIKCTSLKRIIQNAKESGFFDESETGQRLQISRLEIEEEQVAVDEEGNIIAGETVSIQKESTIDDVVKGPILEWVEQGMPTKEIIQKLSLDKNAKNTKKENIISPIKPYTIILPDRAPKKILLDLKKTLEKFPGNEKAQLQIGGKIIPLPMTIRTSTILEKEIEEILNNN